MARLSLVRAIYRLVSPGFRRIRFHPWNVRLRFGVRLPPGVPTHFDTTTIALQKALEKWATNAERILELGTGNAALLSCFLARRLGREVHGVELSASRVQQALQVVRHNSLPVRLWQSDLFGQVQGTYDLIVFNPPYVPSAMGQALGLDKRPEFDGDQVWDGGETGTETIEKFLKSLPPHLAPEGRVLLGVQGFYVPPEVLQPLFEKAGLKVAKRFRTRFNPSDVWVLTSGDEA